MQERGDSPTRIQQSKHHHASLLSKPQSQVPPPPLKVTAITLLVIPNRRDLFFSSYKWLPLRLYLTNIAEASWSCKQEERGH